MSKFLVIYSYALQGTKILETGERMYHYILPCYSIRYYEYYLIIMNITAEEDNSCFDMPTFVQVQLTEIP